MRGALLTPLATLWTRFWFAPVQPHVYGALRLVFGLLALLDLVGATPVALYWPLDALTPVPGSGLGVRAFLADQGLGVAAGWVAFLALALVHACTAAGLVSAWSVPLSFVGSVAQTYWNPYPLSSAHQVLVVVLFCLVWADCGAVLSVDRWLRARQAQAKTPPPMALAWPLRLVQIQVSLIYLNSGLWKLFGEAWRDGSATYLAVSHSVFRRFPYDVPPELHVVLTVLTYATLLWEITFPLLLLSRRWRPIALCFGVAMHVGVWLLLEVGPFSWMMIGSYVAFVEPSTLARWVDARIPPISARAPATSSAK